MRDEDDVQDAEVVGSAVAVRAPAVTGDVASLVHFAIERNVDVAMLERLVALQERVMERDARTAFVEGLTAFQAECPPIRKTETAKITTRKGGQFSYTFAPLDEIARTIRPLLHRHGLSYSWDSDMDGARVVVTCTLRHVAGHTETARFICPTDSEAAMSEAQKFAAALSFGRRQSLVQVLGLTSADDDADGAAGRPQPQDAAERITESQAADLRAKMQEVGADERRFLAFASQATGLPIGSVEEIPTSAYRDALASLEEKRRENERKRSA